MTETARMQFAAGGLARPVVEGGASLGAGFEEEAGRPAVAAGGFAGDRAAGRAVKDEVAGVGFAVGVDDEAVLVAFDPCETASVVFEDAHGVRLPWLVTTSRMGVCITRRLTVYGSNLAKMANMANISGTGRGAIFASVPGARGEQPALAAMGNAFFRTP